MSSLRPHTVAADANGNLTSFDINAFLGATTYYNALGNTGQNARVANIEGGLPLTTHEVFAGSPLVTYAGAGAATTGMTRPHPTNTLHTLAGRGTDARGAASPTGLATLAASLAGFGPATSSPGSTPTAATSTPMRRSTTRTATPR